MTLEEAYLELLDHLGEDVAVGIMLPGGIPFAGGDGILSHQAQKLQRLAGDNDRFYFPSDEHHREGDRRTAERLLGLKDYSGLFMIDTFCIPLSRERVQAVRRTVDIEHPGLDFAIEPGELTVRVTFLEHQRS